VHASVHRTFRQRFGSCKIKAPPSWTVTGI